MSDGGPWTFLGVAGPLICVSCGMPFQHGERTVLMCQGESVADAMTSESVSNFFEAEEDEDASITEKTRMTKFDLVHESCAEYERMGHRAA